MRCKFDGAGWFDGTTEEDAVRSTDSLPAQVPAGPPVEGQPYPNWTGFAWALQAYAAPAPALPPAPAPAPVRRITKLAFRNRFTQAEKVTLEIAALDDASAPMAQRQQAAALRANLADQRDATYIDLDRPDTRAGVQALETATILGVGRALAILDAPVTDEERYRGAA